MKAKHVCFQYERCLDSNPQALVTCRAMIKQNFTVYLVTDLPESEFRSKVIDFALDNNIYHRNVIFNNHKPKDDGFFKRYGLGLYLTSNEFEVWALNAGKPNPIACHLPYERPDRFL
jgi:hypothetical protein